LLLLCHPQVSKYRQVAQKLAGLLARNLATCFRSWREAADEARVNLLRAQRQYTTSTLSKLLPAWQEAAAEARDLREAAEAAADKQQRRVLLSKACRGWVEEMQVVQAQRQGLLQLMLMLLGNARQHLLRETVWEWRGCVQDRIALRNCIATFVNKRRLACLSEFLTWWQQYAAAMRGGKADVTPEAVLLHALTPQPQTRRFSPCATSPAAAYCTWPGVTQAGSPAGQHPQDSRCQSPTAANVRAPSPPGVLPVTSGPGSPLLGPRSAEQDRRLARRWAAMGGAAAEVRPW
jgi:hypothetical protein